MDLPPGTIASRIARGLTRLRAELEPQDAPRHPSGTDVEPTAVEPLVATA
jgi:hypothetical protein